MSARGGTCPKCGETFFTYARWFPPRKKRWFIRARPERFLCWCTCGYQWVRLVAGAAPPESEAPGE